MLAITFIAIVVALHTLQISAPCAKADYFDTVEG